MKPIKIKINLKNLKKNVRIVKKGDVKRVNDINMFELGTLVQVHINQWLAYKKIPDEVTKQLRKKAIIINKGKGKKAKWVKGSKDLINKKHLKPITSCVAEMHRLQDYYASPFPIRGVRFIPNDSIPEFKEKADEIIARFYTAVNDVYKYMDDYIAEAEEELSPDGLFDHKDYPQDLKNRFHMQYRFFELTLPTNAVSAIEDEEAAKFKDLLNEARDTSILALRNGFGKLIKDITDVLSGRLDGERKRMSQGTIDKLGEFMKEFSAKNIFDDNELKSVIESANGILDGVTNKDLKKDEDLIKSINKDLTEVQNELQKGIKTYRRKMKVS